MTRFQPNEDMIADQSRYTEEVLEHEEDPFHKGHLHDATHVHEAKNPLCGDRIRIEMKMGKDGVVDDIYFDGSGCIFSQAGASMLLSHLIEDHGKCSIDDIKNMGPRDALKLAGAPLLPLRQQCFLLAWKVLQSAIYSPIQAATQSDSDSEPRTK